MTPDKMPSAIIHNFNYCWDCESYDCVKADHTKNEQLYRISEEVEAQMRWIVERNEKHLYHLQQAILNKDWKIIREILAEMCIDSKQIMEQYPQVKE